MNIKKVLTPENKNKLRDFSLNISAVVIMNCVLQFLCYPTFEKVLGKELNGVLLTLLSVVSISAGAIGVSCSYSRMVNERVHHPSNGDYIVLLLFGSVLSVTVGAIFLNACKVFSLLNFFVYSLLLIFTALRYYSDVEYKLNTNFFKYFFYYLTLSIGYLIGIFVFKKTENWFIAILIGEMFAVIFSFFTTSLYRKNLKPSKVLKTIALSVGLLLPSTILENLTMHSDRLVLMSFVDGTSVTYYYVASLFGKVIALLTVPINSVLISYLTKTDKQLSKKTWLLFVCFALILASLCFAACLIGSYLILPHLYDFFDLVKPILIPAIISQVGYFVSSVLMVVILRFYGEKKQFLLNIIYATTFFATTIIFTKLYGLKGFTYSSLAVNLLRLIIVATVGFILSNQKKSKIEQ